MTESDEQINLKFNGVDIIRLSFETKKFLDNEAKINVDIKPRLFRNKNVEFSNLFKIIMEVNLFAENYFELRFIAVGNFELNKELDEELKKNFIDINAPAIMYPYVRSFITTISSQMGNSLHTINIPIQFFRGELEEINSMEDNKNKINHEKDNIEYK